MPPKLNSRHELTTALLDASGLLFLTERTPHRFKDFSDTIMHTVRQGDTLFNLAGRFYRPLPRAAGFWWCIADFQPDPIIDPTLDLESGRVMHVPSRRVLLEVIPGVDRRQEF